MLSVTYLNFTSELRSCFSADLSALRQITLVTQIIRSELAFDYSTYLHSCVRLVDYPFRIDMFLQDFSTYMLPCVRLVDYPFRIDMLLQDYSTYLHSCVRLVDYPFRIGMFLQDYSNFIFFWPCISVRFLQTTNLTHFL